MSDKKNRREFLKQSAVAAVGMTGGVGLASEVLAQAKIKSLNKAAKIKPLPKNIKNMSLMPDGSLKSRQEILRQLGFNPNTPPDAWLSICGGIGCSANSAAISPGDRQQLMRRGYQFKGNNLVSMPEK